MEDKESILSHLNGVKADGSDVIGVYPLMKNGTCRFLVFDFDNHDLGSEEIDFANTDEKWQGEVNALRRICEMNGIDPLVERSRSGKGAHVWIFFDKPVPATVARNFGFALLEKGAENVNLKSFKYYDRILPAQDTLDDGKIGNLIALPLQKLALSEGNSAFIDQNWNAYPDQWRTLESKPSLSQEFLEAKIGEWSGVFKYDKKQDETGKPWEKDVRFLSSDAPGGIKMVLSDGIYVETNGLKPSLFQVLPSVGRKSGLLSEIFVTGRKPVLKLLL